MDVDELVRAVQSLNTDDAFRTHLDADRWRSLGQYLTPRDLHAGELLCRQGQHDRTLYLLESGSLQVYVTGAAPGTHRAAILRAGSAIGEAGLFVDEPRLANVEAMTACRVWALGHPRFEELASRQPALAVELLVAAGATMAVRMRAQPDTRSAVA